MSNSARLSNSLASDAQYSSHDWRTEQLERINAQRLVQESYKLFMPQLAPAALSARAPVHNTQQICAPAWVLLHMGYM
jgi:hypothetical protein